MTEREFELAREKQAESQAKIKAQEFKLHQLRATEGLIASLIAEAENEVRRLTEEYTAAAYQELGRANVETTT